MELGFDSCRITSAEVPDITGDNLQQFLKAGHHGTMTWMADTAERRKKPTAMWNDAVSAIVLGMNYGPDVDPMTNLHNREKANISVYARHRDYHSIVKGKLKTLAGWFAAQTGNDVKVFVDTAPLMEKPLAAKSGLGWQGKHTNLVSREFGSWLFLGTILTTAMLPADKPEHDHCGNCTKCLDICPTDAFPAPYKLDARKCISYLTIEHAGPIPKAFRKAMGNRIYGCDDCLAVCPWNKFAQTTREAKLQARNDLASPELEELATLDDQAFRQKFSGSPIKRIGRDRFLRNVLIAIGNSASERLKPIAQKKLNEANPIVRGAAVWALSQLEKPDSFADMRNTISDREADKSVRSEWGLDE